MFFVSIYYVIFIIIMLSHLRDDDGTLGVCIVGEMVGGYPTSPMNSRQVSESGGNRRLKLNYG